MSKKDFIALAALLRTTGEKHRVAYDVQKAYAIETADMCAKVNPQFDRKRFLDACNVSE